MGNKRETIEKLRCYIREYDSVFILKEGIWTGEKFLQTASRQNVKSSLFLVAKPRADILQKYNVEIQEISYEEYCNIEKLYYTYEFSDRIHLLADHIQYGSLSNYISGGLLTEEEAFGALLLR